MAECFSFKGNIAVSHVVVAMYGQSYKVLDKVPQVKGQKTHLELLPQVNTLVVEQFFAWFFTFDKNERKKCHPGYP